MAITTGSITDSIKDSAQSAVNNASSSIIKAPQSVADAAKTSKSKLDTGTTATGQPTLNTPKEAIDSLEGWKDNILSSLKQYAYKIRFYMAEDNPMLPSQSPTYQDFTDRMNKRKQTTIAATGVTGLTIQNLQITTIPSLNKQTRNMSASSFTMVIQEVLGVNLMDNLALAAKNLKIRNLGKCPYYLEISFHGYGEDGAFVHNACTGADFNNGGVWTYQVAIQNIASEFDSTGTKYTITLFPFEELVYQQNNLTLPESMTVQGHTVGDILNGVIKSWNDSIVNTYGFQANQYKIVIPPVQTKDGTTLDIAKCPLKPEKEQFAHKRSYSMDPVAGSTGMIKVHLPKGMAINQVVELVMANASDIQKLGMDVTTTEEFNGKVKEEPRNSLRECVIFKVECTADLMGDATGNNSYDFSLENYQLEYTLRVLPYYTQYPILDRSDVVTSQDPKIQAANAMKLRKSGYLAKRYDYLFTGLNTEVQHVDIKMNLVWQSALPRLLGNGITQEAIAPQDKKNDEVGTTLQSQTDALNRANQELRRVREKEEEHELNQSEIARLSSSDKQEQKDEAEKLRKADQESWSAFTKDRDSTEGQKRISAAKKLKEEATKALLASRSSMQTSRLEQINKATKRTALHEFGEDQTSDEGQIQYKIPVSFVQDQDDTKKKLGTVMNDYYTNDRSIFGSVLDQMYSGLTNGLCQIAMDIRGDPYWLGATNFENNYREAILPPDTVRRVHDAPVHDSITRPNYKSGDVMFLLSFQYPHGIGDTGQPVMKSNDFYTGVYQVTKVTHKFDGGIFSQRIEGKRMPLIEVYKAFGYKDPADVKAEQEAEQKAEEARLKRVAEKKG